jgi:hypothetical protein
MGLVACKDVEEEEDRWHVVEEEEVDRPVTHGRFVEVTTMSFTWVPTLGIT